MKTATFAVITFALGLAIGAYGPWLIAWVAAWPERKLLKDKDAVTVSVDELLVEGDDERPVNLSDALGIPTQKRGRHAADAESV